MKQKYVPIEKQSKRKQREFHTAQRNDWGSINPVTQKVPNLKAYNRKKSKQRYEYEPGLDFLFFSKFHTQGFARASSPVMRLLRESNFVKSPLA